MSFETKRPKGTNPDNWEKYQEYHEKYPGLAAIFDRLAPIYGTAKVVTNCDMLFTAYRLLPTILNEDTATEIANSFNSLITDLEEIRARYEAEIETLKQKEEDYEKKDKALMWERSQWQAKVVMADHKEEEANRLRKEIMSFESAEMRDRARMAELYLQSVDTDNKYNSKAIAWSLGAIYSGTKIPDFGNGE